jgi:3-hexulose-6-phosphate synthase
MATINGVIKAANANGAEAQLDLIGVEDKSVRNRFHFESRFI